MARRSDHSREEIKEMVLQATESIVFRDGYAALTVRKVAMKIGYTVGSIYLVFRNLDDLILHVNARTLDALSKQLEEAAAAQASPERCIARLARAYLAFASDQYHRWSMIFEHRLPEGTDAPEWYRQRVFGVLHLVERQFARLAPARPREEIELAARTLWSGVHGICILSLTGKFKIAGLDDVQRSVDSLIENYLIGWAGSGE